MEPQRILTSIITGSVILAIVAGGVFFFLLKAPTAQRQASFSTSSTTEGENTQNSVSATNEPQEVGGSGDLPRATIYNRLLEETVVKDFTLNPTVVRDRNYPARYYMGEGVTRDFNPTVSELPYTITFLTTDSSFTISLLQEPVKETRMQAEQYLLQTLGLKERQLCGLNYTVSTPFWVNQVYAGANLLFSFCPGATDLP